jgi:hypothetical protein
MKTEEPMRNINPFGLRLQPELKNQLEQAAGENKRSLNAEITARLEESFEEKSFAEGKATVLELKSLMTEISLISALLSMVQQQPQSQERDVVLKQLIDRVDAMGDIQKLFTELMRALPIEQPEKGPISFEYRPDTTPTAKKPIRKGSRPLGVDPEK